MVPVGFSPSRLAPVARPLVPTDYVWIFSEIMDHANVNQRTLYLFLTLTGLRRPAATRLLRRFYFPDKACIQIPGEGSRQTILWPLGRTASGILEGRLNLPEVRKSNFIFETAAGNPVSTNILDRRLSRRAEVTSVAPALRALYQQVARDSGLSKEEVALMMGDFVKSYKAEPPLKTRREFVQAMEDRILEFAYTQQDQTA